MGRENPYALFLSKLRQKEKKKVDKTLAVKNLKQQNSF